MAMTMIHLLVEMVVGVWVAEQETSRQSHIWSISRCCAVQVVVSDAGTNVLCRTNCWQSKAWVVPGRTDTLIKMYWDTDCTVEGRIPRCARLAVRYLSSLRTG